MHYLLLQTLVLLFFIDAATLTPAKDALSICGNLHLTTTQIRRMLRTCLYCCRAPAGLPSLFSWLCGPKSSRNHLFPVSSNYYTESQDPDFNVWRLRKESRLPTDKRSIYTLQHRWMSSELKKWKPISNEADGSSIAIIATWELSKK